MSRVRHVALPDHHGVAGGQPGCRTNFGYCDLCQKRGKFGGKPFPQLFLTKSGLLSAGLASRRRQTFTGRMLGIPSPAQGEVAAVLFRDATSDAAADRQVRAIGGRKGRGFRDRRCRDVKRDGALLRAICAALVRASCHIHGRSWQLAGRGPAMSALALGSAGSGASIRRSPRLPASARASQLATT